MTIPRRDPRGLSWAPLAGAAAIAALALVLIFVVGNVGGTHDPNAASGTAVAADGALACPKVYSQRNDDTAGWVPSAPSGISSRTHLVPSGTPRTVIVCVYTRADPNSTVDSPLDKRVRLVRDLGTIVDRLRAAPKAPAVQGDCPSTILPSDRINYLVGLTYLNGSLWVSAPGYRCEGSTNGVFITDTNLAPSAASAVAKGVWPS